MAKVVIVDDSLYMRTMLKHIISDAGHEVIGEAAEGKTALSIIDEKDPDIITLDIILPENTGLDILKAIKEKKPSAKIIMVSAVGQEVIIEEAKHLGASNYIVKPFSEEKVSKIINKVAGTQTY